MLSKKFDLVDCRYFNLMNIREEIVWHEALWSWGLHRHIGYIGYVLLIKSFRWLWFYWVVVYFILVRLSFFPSFYFCFVSFSSPSLYSPLVPALTPFPLPHFHFLFLILPFSFLSSSVTPFLFPPQASLFSFLPSCPFIFLPLSLPTIPPQFSFLFPIAWGLSLIPSVIYCE